MGIIHCDRCGEKLEYLETYIRLPEACVCDTCYMNMSRREWVRFCGGDIAVVM